MSKFFESNLKNGGSRFFSQTVLARLTKYLEGKLPVLFNVRSNKSFCSKLTSVLLLLSLLFCFKKGNLEVRKLACKKTFTKLAQPLLKIFAAVQVRLCTLSYSTFGTNFLNLGNFWEFLVPQTVWHYVALPWHFLTKIMWI